MVNKVYYKLPVLGERPDFLSDNDQIHPVMAGGRQHVSRRAEAHNWMGSPRRHGPTVGFYISEEHRVGRTLQWNSEHPDVEDFIPFKGTEVPADWDGESVLVFDKNAKTCPAIEVRNLTLGSMQRCIAQEPGCVQVIGYRKKKEEEEMPEVSPENVQRLIQLAEYVAASKNNGLTYCSLAKEILADIKPRNLEFVIQEAMNSGNNVTAYEISQAVQEFLDEKDNG